jgi:hypothetical protein
VPAGDAGYARFEVNVWDTAIGKRLWGLPEGPGFGSLFFAPDGSALFVGDRDGELYEPRTGEVRRKIARQDAGRLLLGRKGEVDQAAVPASLGPEH